MRRVEHSRSCHSLAVSMTKHNDKTSGRWYEWTGLGNEAGAAQSMETSRLPRLVACDRRHRLHMHIHELLTTSINMNMHKKMRTAKHKQRFALPPRFTHSRPMTRQLHHDLGWTLHQGPRDGGGQGLLNARRPEFDGSPCGQHPRSPMQMNKLRFELGPVDKPLRRVPWLSS